MPCVQYKQNRTKNRSLGHPTGDSHSRRALSAHKDRLMPVCQEPWHILDLVLCPSKPFHLSRDTIVLGTEMEPEVPQRQDDCQEDLPWTEVDQGFFRRAAEDQTGRMLTFDLVIVISLCVTSHSYGNLLVNSDLEQGDLSNAGSGWFGRSCTTSLSSDRYTGSSSARVSNRQAKWAGLAQYIGVEEGKRYFFSGYIRLLNTAAGKMTGEVIVTLNYHNTVTGEKKYVHMSTVRFMQPNMWERIGGDITILPGYDRHLLYIQVSYPEVDYLLDTTSLTEIPSLAMNWKAVANAGIDANRRADINMVLTSGRVEGVTVEIHQLTSEFGFGTAVSAERIVDSNYNAYQNFFYDNFEWATIENKLKWSQTERNKGVSNDAGVIAVNELVKRGIKVRGHTVFWGVPGKDPVWVQSLQGDALVQAMLTRGKNVTWKTLGKLEHWDVNNENVHGNFYEEATGRVNITMDIFSEIRSMDPKPKLFLNDFAIVNSGRFTQAYRNQAKMFRTETPIYGVGIQSHLTPPLDLTLIKHRLDQMVEVGLPVWITELVKSSRQTKLD
ncbi:uncharacterized protein [Haliotis asinina]|uniref:uncharacterized protein n=1 Tax=Haliotis asinina TaxID=109174 RepID=UPI0035325C35